MRKQTTQPSPADMHAGVVTRHRLFTWVLAVPLVAACAASTPSAPLGVLAPPAAHAAHAAGVTTPAVGQSVWVKVAVATLWTSPAAPRQVDAKAISAPVDIRGWLAAMSTS